MSIVRPPELDWAQPAAGSRTAEVVRDLLEHEPRRLDRTLLPGEHAAGQDAVEADPSERAEAGLPVHLALTDVEVLVDAGGGARRVDDVAVARRRAMVQDVGDVDLGEDRPGMLDHRRDVIAEVVRVRRTEHVADDRRVDRPDEGDGLVVALDEVVRVRLEVQPDAFPLEDRQQLLHRPPELRLAAGRSLWPPVELRVHHRAADVDRQLDRPLPVANGRLALVLVWARPAIERQDRRQLDPGLPQGGPELVDPSPVGPRMAEEGDEVGSR